MINGKNAKEYCCEDISLIENYNSAINDLNEMWDCHHRLETDLGISRYELINTGRYYNIEAKYLIFLKSSEHISLHKKGCNVSDESKQKNREKHLGKHHTEESKRKISEHNARISVWKGNNLSEAHKQKISEACKGKHIQKYKWITPTGEIKEMDKVNALRWHSDWKQIDIINEEPVFCSPLF